MALLPWDVAYTKEGVALKKVIGIPNFSRVLVNLIYKRELYFQLIMII